MMIKIYVYIYTLFGEPRVGFTVHTIADRYNNNDLLPFLPPAPPLCLNSLINQTQAKEKGVTVLVCYLYHSETMESKRKNGGKGEIVDGSKIMELVGNEQVFSNFVDHKFDELDKDRDGKLSMKELEPAVADIGAGLGLPAQGTSPDSDHIYFEVLNEFTHGKQEKVSKTEFKEVLSDILLGMAAGLKQDPIVILRMDGEDLLEFVNGPSYEAEMASIFSQIESPSGSLREHVIEAFGRLTVDQGIPPTSDSWVFNNIVDPALSQAGPALDKPAAQETFLEEFKKVALSVVDFLKEKPVIVAHSENTFDGRGVKRLLSNKFELDRTLNLALENLPKDRNVKISKDYLQVALDLVSPSAGLPPVGAIEEVMPA
ncbi:hypothetical protein AAZV13_04G006000 [Glycine max]|uniref:EF-hand domain-containing protein n=1 Tax=Glycine max TaxID=3847 RepID=A0A0R0K1N5_SOYBN